MQFNCSTRISYLWFIQGEFPNCSCTERDRDQSPAAVLGKKVTLCLFLAYLPKNSWHCFRCPRAQCHGLSPSLGWRTPLRLRVPHSPCDHSTKTHLFPGHLPITSHPSDEHHAARSQPCSPLAAMRSSLAVLKSVLGIVSVQLVERA